MSSSSHARVTSRSERRTANDNGSTQPRVPSGLHAGGSKSERTDPRRTQSPPASVLAAGHRRAPSGSQRTSKNVEERRTERVQVSTRETITSRPRSPERRSAPQPQPSERTKPPEQTRLQPGENRPKPKAEALQGTVFLCTCFMVLTVSLSTMEPRSLFGCAYICSFSVASIDTSASFSSSRSSPTRAIARTVLGSPGSSYRRGSADGIYGLRRPVHPFCEGI